MKGWFGLLLLFGLVLLAGCRQPDVPTPTPVVVDMPMVQEGVLISELLYGVAGDNNREFVELYNAGTAAVDLRNWSLWYRFQESGQEERLIYWNSSTEIPGHGYYLLARQGQDWVADATFDLPLAQKGGVVLRNTAGEVVDVLGWGDAPEGFFMGQPAEMPALGSSLERLAGTGGGNNVFSGNNQADFGMNPNPNPQNSGAEVIPPLPALLRIAWDVPQTIIPGEQVNVGVVVGNLTTEALADVRAVVPLPEGFTVLSLPEGAVAEDGRVVWTVGELSAMGESAGTISLQSPYTYAQLILRGAYAEWNGERRYGQIAQVTLGGGVVPIGVARQMVGQEAIIEGVATMFTGGFFAGSTGTKFYMEDGTGGIQVYIPGGMGIVQVKIGDRVRVTGGMEVYRDSLEIVPDPSGVEIIQEVAGTPPPLPVSLTDINSNDQILGRLTQVEGTITAIVEESFSYEIDVMDNAGTVALVLLEKDTGATAEPLEVGQQYEITGISEFYIGQRQIKPRLQQDFRLVYPPVLRLTQEAPLTIKEGETITVAITVYNHTAAPMNGLQLTTSVPASGATLIDLLDGGVLNGEQLQWSLPALAADGASATVRYRLQVAATDKPFVELQPALATATEWTEPAVATARHTFLGDSVPIWAIQGQDFVSPYVQQELPTAGVVTAVFPDLGGFWLQEWATDGNEQTSAGIFVLLPKSGYTSPNRGDYLQLTAKVRELSGQTTLSPISPEAIVTLSSAAAIPLPITYDPPQEPTAALTYNESLEGMLVSVTEPATAIAPMNRFGEYVLVYQRYGVSTAPRGAANGFFIMIDDGSQVAHENSETLGYTIQQGDVVSQLAGPLAYTFDHYKIEPVAMPVVQRTELPLPALPTIADGQFSIATFNAENLFDHRPPHPSSPLPPDQAGYELRLNKLAETILAMGSPTVVGLQEIESLQVLEELVLLPQLVELAYQPFLIEGGDSRGIDVAFLVRENAGITIGNVENYPAPEGLTSRHPLVLPLTLTLAGQSQTIYLINNHFTALSGGEAATEPQRTAQANWNVTIMEQLRTKEPEAWFVVLGDLNSFYQTPPINSLQATGLRHINEFFADPSQYPYTYIFEGATQALDHILLSPELFAHLQQVEPLHLNTPFSFPEADDTSARHLSDHDPLIIILGGW